MPMVTCSGSSTCKRTWTSLSRTKASTGTPVCSSSILTQSHHLVTPSPRIPRKQLTIRVPGVWRLHLSTSHTHGSTCQRHTIHVSSSSLPRSIHASFHFSLIERASGHKVSRQQWSFSTTGQVKRSVSTMTVNMLRWNGRWDRFRSMTTSAKKSSCDTTRTSPVNRNTTPMPTAVKCSNEHETFDRRGTTPWWKQSVATTIRSTVESGSKSPIDSSLFSRVRQEEEGSCMIVIVCLFVSVDRSEGGGSIRDGSVEVMVHRRTLNDDSLGVGEPLSETAFGTGLVVRGRHILIAETPATSALYHRVGSQRLFMHPVATFALTPLPYANYTAAYRQTWSALNDSLPLNVHLLTFDQLASNVFLVRVENYFELKEDDTYSQPVTIDLQALFRTLGTISATEELALGANIPLANVNRLDWSATDERMSDEGTTSKSFWPEFASSTK